MRRFSVLIALATVMCVTPPRVHAADPLVEARRLYNLGEYDAAARAAREAVRVPSLSDSARVVLGRVLLEQFRRSADDKDLSAAREALRMVNANALDPRDRVELALGQAEAMFLTDRFGVAAELFDPLIERAAVLGPAARERVLDWWATAIDRQAQGRPPSERAVLYQRVLDRMSAELTEDPGSTPASYWAAAAARGTGDLERAWNAALAAWVRATLARDRGVMLRGDLDRLVIHAIAPERATRTAPRESKQALATMLAEWETFKTTWSR